MALDEGDKAIIRDIAFDAAEHTSRRVIGSFETRLQLHRAECPIGKEFMEAQNKMRGAWFVISIVASIVATVATIAVEWLRK